MSDINPVEESNDNKSTELSTPQKLIPNNNSG